MSSGQVLASAFFVATSALAPEATKLPALPTVCDHRTALIERRYSLRRSV